MLKLGIIIVNYKTIDETVLYIKQELAKITTQKKIVVVDVECKDINHAKKIAEKTDGQLIETLESIADPKKQVYVIPHPKNIGYAKGNNLGSWFLLKQFKVEYFLFSNNDIKFINTDVIEKLLEESNKLKNFGAIGPKVLDDDANDQSPMKYCNIWKRIVLPYGFFPFLHFLPRLRVAFFSDTILNATFGNYYRLMGCFIVVKADVFTEINGFDEGTFLYAEEMILSEKMSMIGKNMYFNPAVSIYHAHSQVIKNSMNKEKMARVRLQSELYYYRKYVELSKLESICTYCSVFVYLNLYRPMIRFIKPCFSKPVLWMSSTKRLLLRK